MFWIIALFTLFTGSSSQCMKHISENYSSQQLNCTDYDLWGNIFTESSFQDGFQIADLTSTSTHPFVLDFTLENPTERNTYEFLMRFFDLIFLNVFQKYSNLTRGTFLLAMHPNETSGLKIYMKGVKISHADYEYFCQLLQDSLFYEEELSIYLNCPSSFSWSSCNQSKEMDFFMPVLLVDVQFQFHQEQCMWKSYRIITNVYMHPKDFFNRNWKSIVQTTRDTYLHFPTQIIEGERHPGNIAVFKSHLNRKYYSIVKENILRKGKNFVYDFLKENSHHIDFRGSPNSVLETWFIRFQQRTQSQQHYYFQWFDNVLRKLCPHLKDEKSPLETILKAYERPVYYALYNMMLDHKEDVQEIRKHFPFLSNNLTIVPPKEAENLTFNTVLYCAYLTGNESFINHIGIGYDWVIKTITTPQHLIENIIWIQQKMFPIVQSTDRKPSNFTYIPGPNRVYFWNTQNWKEMDDPISDIQGILRYSLGILNTRSELPAELNIEFEEWIEKLAYNILLEIKEKGEIKSHNVTEDFEIYGYNVPEYYFLNYE